ncbi:MAG: DUF6502 family protein [bacterium]
MSDNLRQTLNAALTAILKPLVRIFLAKGFSYKAFCDVLKWVYVDVAMNDFKLEGKRQTKSRVAVITGITRVEVDRLLKTPPPEAANQAEKYHRGARVLSGWDEDPAYQNKVGKPLKLKVEGERPSFFSLVDDHSGGTPPKSVLDELVHAGSVRWVDDHSVELIRPYIIPEGGKSLPQKVNIMGLSTSYLLNTIHHNIQPNQPNLRYQRIVLNRRIPLSAVDELQDFVRSEGEKYEDSIDGKMQQLSRSHNDEHTVQAGIGTYYFQIPQKNAESDS